MRLRRTLSALAALALLCSPALAANFIFSGNTTGDPTFNRPVSIGSLSGVGTAVPYDVVPFYVTVTGSYSMELLSTTSGYDPYALAYSSFAPGSPLVGLINGDDDWTGPLPMLSATGTGLDASNITPGDSSNFVPTGLPLTAFTQYYAVVTGFDNSDFGVYEGAIGRGPGDAIGGLVPEPSSIALGAFGLASAVVFGLRRRSA